jgi:phenylalanyl-tRNA synthetase alpha chain
MLRDLEKTLTNETANALRDRIYLAIHQGTEHQWAPVGRPAVPSEASA